MTKEIMNINILRKAIAGAYIDYYGDNISTECIDRIVNYYRQLTKENHMITAGQLPALYKRESIKQKTERNDVIREEKF